MGRKGIEWDGRGRRLCGWDGLEGESLGAMGWDWVGWKGIRWDGMGGEGDWVGWDGREWD